MDVRAPVEFAQGALPGAVNLPILDNEERARVGTTYKKAGREEALRLGHALVSGEIKEQRLELWARQIQKSPQTVLYCFRGGLRSQITQSWLRERGVDRPLIEGGFKKARHFLLSEMEQFAQSAKLLVVTGPTGSAKTRFLNRARDAFPSLDLEAVARHRGSAFGGRPELQPSQVDFENQLAVEVMKLGRGQEGRQMTVLLEDESRLIGRCALPENLFLRMRSSEVLFLETDFEQRVENILEDYVIHSPIGQGSPEDAARVFAYYRAATQAISKKLGGLRTQEVLQDLAVAEERFRLHRDLAANRAWIAKLLSYYYDPLYAASLKKRNPSVILRGSAEVLLSSLQNLRA